jgi:predicted ATP-dependent serine protease
MKTENEIISARDLLNLTNYKLLALPKEYKRFLGFLPANYQWTMLLHGVAGSGKSTYSLVLAKELAKFGLVLYGNFEEAVGPTLKEKVRIAHKRGSGVNYINRIHFLQKNTEEELWHQLDSDMYKYCIVDSLSQITNSDKKITEFWSKIMQYPNVSFILISHARRAKDGKKESDYRGMSTIGHIVDINQRVIEGVVWNDKNRYLGKDCSQADGYNIFKNAIINQKKRIKDKNIKK